MFLILFFVDLFFRDDLGIIYKVICSYWILFVNKYNNSVNKLIYDNNVVFNYIIVYFLDVYLIRVGKIISYSYRCFYNIKK